MGAPRTTSSLGRQILKLYKKIFSPYLMEISPPYGRVLGVHHVDEAPEPLSFPHTHAKVRGHPACSRRTAGQLALERHHGRRFSSDEDGDGPWQPDGDGPGSRTPQSRFVLPRPPLPKYISLRNTYPRADLRGSTTSLPEPRPPPQPRPPLPPRPAALAPWSPLQPRPPPQPRPSLLPRYPLQPRPPLPKTISLRSTYPRADPKGSTTSPPEPWSPPQPRRKP